MDSTGSAGPWTLVPEGYYSTGTGAAISWGDGKWAPPGGIDSTACTTIILIILSFWKFVTVYLIYLK